MRKTMITAIVMATAGVAGYYFGTPQSANQLVEIVDLTNVEALSKCEVSSVASENPGYCVRQMGGDLEICVSSVVENATRCNGTILTVS